MDIKSFHDFLDYYDKVRGRTKIILDRIPKDKLEWTYREGKFTLGDLIRHIAAIERHMYAENVHLKPSLYNGCGKELADGYDSAVKFLDDTHRESMEIFYALDENTINAKTATPAGTPITVWKWLRLMAEHEIHHRGQIYLYLSILGVEVPALYGLTSEQVVSLRGQ